MKATRRMALTLSIMGTALVLGSGVALAAIIHGTNSSETIVGTAGSDTIDGLGGNDELYGRGGADILDGGDGADFLFGISESGVGDDGANVLTGGPGDDGLMGGVGVDTLTGGPGNDTIVEGPYEDASGEASVSGGGGADSIDVASSPASKDAVDCGEGVDSVEADPLDVVAGDCENVERIQIAPGEPDVEEPTGEVSVLSEFSHHYLQNIPAFGAPFVPPKFDVREGWRVVVHPQRQGGVQTSYAVYSYGQEGGTVKCRIGGENRLSDRFRFAENGRNTIIWRNGSFFRDVCVRANIRSARSKVIEGNYLERQGF